MSGGRGEAPETEPRPHAVIVAGPNGAGKSTLAPKLLAQEFGIRIYVNSDVIAQGLAGFDPASAGIRAGRIMHSRSRSRWTRIRETTDEAIGGGRPRGMA